MKTAVTLCRVPEAAAGPFVFHDELPEGFAKAAEHGFDAVELFFPAPDAYAVAEITRLQETHGLGVAAIGTGAGMLKHGLSLTDPDPSKRQAARRFVRGMVELGAPFKAPAIIGSMQGKAAGDVSREQALDWLAESLHEISTVAADHGIPLIYEPLNRYETNLHNRIAESTEWLRSRSLDNVVILADLFHMNIEETDPAAAIRAGGDRIGHVHFADSHRGAMGLGHTDARGIVGALLEIGYGGYLSAEVLPLPDADQAAAQTMKSIRSLLP